MSYPVWHVAGFSTGLVIAIMAVLHVFVSQFAVGGGIYLAWMERKASKENSPLLLDWLQKHTRFFLLLTMVFGGLSGVGIWFTMSVCAPAGTSLLIHNFVFLWASEWTFFLIEIVALMVYYYTYPLMRQGKFSPRAHQIVGWIYAFAAYMSLVLINGIITFMLTPGQGPATGNIWLGFFNPTFFPSLVFRTGLCLMLAGMYALLTASQIKDREVKRQTIKINALWICIPFFIMLAGAVWYYLALPPDRKAAILRGTADILPALRVFALILPIAFVAGVISYVSAEKLRVPLALLILAVGLGVVGSFEVIRENGRRPWLAPGLMYSNGYAVQEWELAHEQGLAAGSGWIRHLETIEAADARPASVEADGLTKGSVIFAQQCGSCHGVGGPRIDIVPRAARLTPDGLKAQISGMGRNLEYMPPFFGDESDSLAVLEYLNAVIRERQSGGSNERQ